MTAAEIRHRLGEVDPFDAERVVDLEAELEQRRECERVRQDTIRRIARARGLPEGCS